MEVFARRSEPSTRIVRGSPGSGGSTTPPSGGRSAARRPARDPAGRLEVRDLEIARARDPGASGDEDHEHARERLAEHARPHARRPVHAIAAPGHRRSVVGGPELPTAWAVGNCVVKPRWTVIAAAALLALGAPAPASAARKKPPELTRIRCVPATSTTCRTAIKVTIGRQLQFSGRRIYKGMRVSFRWSRGALATKLDRTRVGYVARVPAGTRAGRVSVTLSDRAGRRSNARTITVDAPPRIGGPAPAPGTLAGRVQGQRHVDLGALALRRRRRGGDRRTRPRGRGHDRVRQELGRRREPLGAVQPRAGRRPARQRPARLRVAVRLRQRPAGRGQPGRRRDRRRRRLPRDRRRIAVQGQVRGGAAVHRRAAGDGRPGLPDRPHLVPVRRLPRDAPVLGLPRPGRRAGQPAAGLLEGHRRHRRRRLGPHAGPEPHLRHRDRPARPDLRQHAARGHRPLPRAVGGLRQRRAVVVVVAAHDRARLGRAGGSRSPRWRCRPPIRAGRRSRVAARATRSSACSST